MNIIVRPDQIAQSLALEAEQQGMSFDPSHKPPPPKSGKGGPDLEEEQWIPPLTQTGLDLFYCDKPYMLAHGERGGGKTIGVCHRLLKHAYDFGGSAVCMTTLTRSSATLGGAWTKLQSYGVPAWQEGLGIEGEGRNGEIIYKMDDARNRYFWMRACDGEWSMFFLRSMMHGEHIQSRIKGMEFTGFFFDELTETDDEGYFIHPIQQLRRIPGIPNQFYLGACNPSDEGEDHWVYKRFFTGFDDPKEKKPKRKSDYATFHFPMTENTFMTPDEKEKYLETVYEACRTDPTAEDRLLKGIWRKKPSGKGIFKEYFDRNTHVKGNREKNSVIIPTGRVLDVGYDMGTANTSISFLQKFHTRTGLGWAIFDELALVEKYMPIPQLAPLLLKHMNYWCERCNTPFIFNHISDSAAFDQMRPDGSYDARKLEEEVHRELREHPERYPGLKHLIRRRRDELGMEILGPAGVRGILFKLVPCEKPAGSVPARVKIAISKLQSSDLLVSARCVKTIEMFENLECDEEKSRHHPKRSRHIHVFDSATYPIYHHEMGGVSSGVNLGPSANYVDLDV